MTDTAVELIRDAIQEAVRSGARPHDGARYIAERVVGAIPLGQPFEQDGERVVLVPVEATIAMQEAAYNVRASKPNVTGSEIYEAMIEAAATKDTGENSPWQT